MSKFKILIIILLLTILLYLTGCTQEISGQQKSWIKNLIDNVNKKSSQEASQSNSSQTTCNDPKINNDALENNLSEEIETTENYDKETITIEENNNETYADASLEDTVQNDPGSHKYAVIASGASLDRQHYKWFLNSTNMAYKLLKNNGFIDENIYYLFENSKELFVDYEATIDNFKKISDELQNKTNDSDDIILFLIGHGSYINTNSYFSLKDYNLSDIELAQLFKTIRRNKLIFVFSPCNSGGFIDDLSGENTIIITSTRKDESNRAAFIEPFLTSFDGPGDINSDGRVNFGEAFDYACLNVKEQFVGNGWDILTEHAQLDDNGDKISHEYPIPSGQDGLLAEDTYLK